MADGPQRAMILAAGLGTRMRTLTTNKPKALIEVLDKPLIDYAIERFLAAGIADIVVNLHYEADQLQTHLERRIDANIHFSDERGELLDTGGGVAKALPFFEGQPFYTHNSDSTWFEEGTQNLNALASAWRDADMDALMLVASTETALGFDGAGDFFLEDDGRLRRRGGAERAPFVWTGVQIIHPRLFDGCPSGPFSSNVLWDKALERQRLFGLALDGTWMHVGTPEGLTDAETFLRKSAAGSLNRTA